MFLLVPSDRPGYHKARISDDNLTIEWPAGTDNAWTEPPWNDLFMPQYEKEFLAARSDYMLSEVRLRKLA
jgi:hypothetical protein